MIEIEIRGKLNRKEFGKLKSFLDRKAKQKDCYKRISVDISPGFDPITRTWKNSSFDLRLKKSGTTEKISLKVGKFHLKEREEIEVKLKEGQFLDALKMFETLGFDKGMIYFWESWEYEYQGFEVKISKYTNDYYIWEIESDNPKKDPHDLANTLSLKPYSEEEYRKAIDWENQNIHKLYSLELVKELLRK
ncbi:MAG: hypothetical protein UT24_C0004G0046 [Candidatus Woesebacteria bacterium GW2011_GWB1_39_12]|uniref:CYTH domain-containing protein n=2 Tax=Candidatus Woeseibacteriota TaxID=1752722 RepID=A0A0G0M2K3_9BACT|nr:MAG: hypothetical protein UT23_C0003G0050 [Candidatus Woesebacteria bacterium GW2011_GWA1_39_12]KKR01483.1 MAG: hypothetical protein UT24_C0004G0046 [Candidatus Woesebacteria bacterium GW2011_GWB1_39_12]